MATATSTEPTASPAEGQMAALPREEFFARLIVFNGATILIFGLLAAGSSSLTVSNLLVSLGMDYQLAGIAVIYGGVLWLTTIVTSLHLIFLPQPRAALSFGFSQLLIWGSLATGAVGYMLAANDLGLDPSSSIITGAIIGAGALAASLTILSQLRIKPFF